MFRNKYVYINQKLNFPKITKTQKKAGLKDNFNNKGTACFTGYSS